MNGIALTEEEKLRILPDLKMQSRMKYLEKREKETLEKVKAVLKDEKEIFDNSELTIKELKMRHLKEKITAYA
jgi:pre-mRNA-splicing factor ATP-dependent RNA helicase DHX16